MPQTTNAMLTTYVTFQMAEIAGAARPVPLYPGTDWQSPTPAGGAILTAAACLAFWSCQPKKTVPAVDK